MSSSSSSRRFIDLTRIPLVREGFYATNNQFQRTAPKGFIEVKVLENTNVKSTMKDGVLRLIISRKKLKNAADDNKCTLTLPLFTGKSGRYLENHPFVVNGRKEATVAKLTAEGGLYFVVDVPGADEIDVFIHGTEIRFYAENKNVFEYDESGRIYLGSVNSPSASPSPESFNWEAKYGVLKINISSP